MKKQQTTMGNNMEIKEIIYKNKKGMITITVFMLIAQLLSQGIPYFLKIISDSYSLYSLYTLLFLTLGLICAGLIRYLSDYMADKYYSKYTGYVGLELLRNFISIVLKSNKAVFSKFNPDQLSRMATNDIENLKKLYFNKYFISISTMTQIVTLLFFISIIDLPLGLLTIAWYALFYFLSRKYIDKVAKHRSAERIALTSVLSFAKDAIYGNSDLKYFTDSKYYLKKFTAENEKYIETNTALMLTSSQARYLSYIGSFTNIAVIMLYKSLFNQGVSAGTLIAMYMYSQSYSSIFSNILSLRSFKKDIAAIKKPINEFYEVSSESGENTLDLREKITSIRLENVSVAYENKQILKDISMEFRRGTISFINGKSGAGKTSLLNAMLGEIEYSGKITIDAIDIKNVKPSSLQEKTGLIGQNIYLLNATIKDNITLYDSSVAKEMVAECARISHIKDIDQEIGTSEIEKVSGGERKRIGFSRMLLRIHTKDIVILDETFANIDRATTKDLAGILTEQTKDKILIIITHDEAVKQLFPPERVVEYQL